MTEYNAIELQDGFHTRSLRTCRGGDGDLRGRVTVRESARPSHRGGRSGDGESARHSPQAFSHTGFANSGRYLAAYQIGYVDYVWDPVFGTSGLLADSSYRVGALTVSFSVIATAEPARAIRFVNVPLGAWVVAAPWVFGAPMDAMWNSVVVGVLLILLSAPRGAIRDEYGEWWQQYVV